MTSPLSMSWRRATLHAALLLPLLALSGCGDAATAVDPYYGTVDATAFDAKFLPSTDKKACPGGPCYAPQQGYAHGKAFFFYNLGAVGTKALGTLTPASAKTVFDFPTGCDGKTDFDAGSDAYPHDTQFPIFSALPLATTAFGVNVLPLVISHGVNNVTGNVCNDLKDAASIGPAGGPPGHFGATDGDVGPVLIRAVVDASAPLNPGTSGVKLTAQRGWYRGLQLSYLEGGEVPVDAKGNLAAMDGVILDPTSAGFFAKPTDAKVVLLPAVPGEAGYSPIVRLHDFTLPAGKLPGDYKGLCGGSLGACAASDLDVTTAKSAFNTIFIAASAP
jgi:hypothetical protein